ncbi:hypothetical protein PY254_16280 [Rhodanobacter sp. AS-Z3]|uniref:hypothetical protein n=1 Tax=Rhodanobacter sp. AS-Z3 TaxID=3031330 RepID=UPI00247A7D62|nr:hypothetical protein [Rhodanobacter sp. AS-Z3]WEN14770.1 hypothetical protein PY254_16280 [Rhodanobacter sp. AS-Z3]
MSPVKNLAAVLALSLATASAAYADGFSYRFSGFGTVGYAATDTNDVMLTNPGQIDGARKGGSALVDSRLGGQLDFTFTPALSATVQGLARQDQKGDFAPVLEWAFLRYKVSNSVAVRIGRLGFPTYLVSDYRYVGYANPWVRAPLEVYKLAPVDNYEGADITWSHDVGQGFLTLQALAGHISNPAADANGGRLKVNQLVGGYVTYEIGNLRLRGGVSSGKVSYWTNNTNALFGGLQQVGLVDVRNLFNADNSHTTFSSLGFNYDAGNILATGEYAKLHSSARLLGDSAGWYGTFGYRLSKVMPYVTWAGQSKQSDLGKYSIPSIPQLAPLAAGVHGLAASSSQHTVSLGVKIDVHSNVALKFQADHVQPSAGGGLFSDVRAGYHGQSVNVYSAVVDFIF